MLRTIEAFAGVRALSVSKRRKIAKGALVEGATAGGSVLAGFGLAEATKEVIWDPNPLAVGDHITNVGLPLPVKQIIDYIYSSGSHTTINQIPLNFLKNAGIYGAMAFLVANAAIVMTYALDERRKKRVL